MSNEINKLKEIGTEKIHEATHIPPMIIEAILNEDYGEMTKVQILGFISILEREFSVDLSSLKQSFQSEEGKLAEAKPIEADESESITSRMNKKWLLAAALALLLVIVLFAVIGGGDKQEVQSVEVVTEVVTEDETATTSVEDVEERASVSQKPDEETVPNEEIESNEETASDEDSSDSELAAVPVPEKSVEKKPAAPEYFYILPKLNLWIGLIDLSTHKRSVKITQDMVELDAKKTWLLVFGHGSFKIENGEQVLDFNRQSKLRFLYEDGEIREIDVAEYKARNRGKNW